MLNSSDIGEVYYFNKDYSHTVEFYINRMLCCSSIQDAIHIYLDMKTNISAKIISKYMKQTINVQGQNIKVKDLPIIKKIHEELDYVRIFDYEVIVGASVNQNGEISWFGARKYEILDASESGINQIIAKNRENAVIKGYIAKRNFYNSINKAIKDRNIAYLESNITFLTETPCYGWVIPFYQLRVPESSKNIEPSSLRRTNMKTNNFESID